jgi:hypothetical protein
MASSSACVPRTRAEVLVSKYQNLVTFLTESAQEVPALRPLLNEFAAVSEYNAIYAVVLEYLKPAANESVALEYVAGLAGVDLAEVPGPIVERATRYVKLFREIVI